MKLADILNERINTNVKFKYFEDVEGDNNRGWQVDQIEAFLNGENVGYIKLSWIPRERFNQRYHSVIDYVDNIEGSNFRPYSYRDVRIENIPIDELRKNMFYAASTARGYVSSEEQESYKTMSNKEVFDYYQELIKDLNKRYSKKFKEFEQWHVDKPIVDFIRVNDQYKRQGIGTALYRAAYDYLKNKELRLYASGIQSKEAQATWKQLEKDYPVGEEKFKMGRETFTRRYFK